MNNEVPHITNDIVQSSSQSLLESPSVNNAQSYYLTALLATQLDIGDDLDLLLEGFEYEHIAQMGFGMQYTGLPQASSATGGAGSALSHIESSSDSRAGNGSSDLAGDIEAAQWWLSLYLQLGNGVSSSGAAAIRKHVRAWLDGSDQSGIVDGTCRDGAELEPCARPEGHADVTALYSALNECVEKSGSWAEVQSTLLA